MTTICGINCEGCPFSTGCKGCAETCGKPFGGTCIAAEYIKTGGKDAYREFKEKLRLEINELLKSLDLPGTNALYELAGSYVNLEFPLTNGQTVKFMDDRQIYLGCQIELADTGRCAGVAAGTDFIVVSTCGPVGTGPELVMYKKR
ncbi:MAG: hypothetical protein CW338_04840 [Clostridiales bacterium]|nr:hypothetical protein [Clostridiales bacterium]